MAYSKVYSRINWINRSDGTTTPLGATNLNGMDYALNELDNRVIDQELIKADKATVLEMVRDVSYDESTGILLVTYLNGKTTTLDTKLEKLAVNFSYDEEKEKLIITLDDGTTQEVDLSALITQYEFLDSDTLAFSIDENGKVSAIVKEGSIQEKHLQPNYLADIKVEAENAKKSKEAAAVSEANAKASETNSAASAVLSESYAHGGTESRGGEDTDNAKYYMERAKEVSAIQVATTESAGIVKPDGDTIVMGDDGLIKLPDNTYSKISELPIKTRIFRAVGENTANSGYATLICPDLDELKDGDIFLIRVENNASHLCKKSIAYKEIEYGAYAQYGLGGNVNAESNQYYPYWYANHDYMYTFNGECFVYLGVVPHVIISSVYSAASTSDANTLFTKYGAHQLWMDVLDRTMKLKQYGIIDTVSAGATITEPIDLYADIPVLIMAWGSAASAAYGYEDSAGVYGSGCYYRVLHDYYSSAANYASGTESYQISGGTLMQTTNVPFTLTSVPASRLINLVATKGYVVRYSVYQLRW